MRHGSIAARQIHSTAQPLSPAADPSSVPQPREPRMSQFSRTVRGGAVIGLLTMASVSVLLSTAGLPFDPVSQFAAGAWGVLLGGVIGAREAA